MAKLSKHISTFSLMMTGITTIVGSGWLLGTQKIANIAGPAGIISWVFGAFIALIVGLLFVEMGTAYPSSGGIGYYTNVTHGRFCGFLTSWINWLSIVAVAPIEAQSIIQYLSQLSPLWNRFYDVPTHELTHIGILFAVVLMFLFTLINYWSVKFFIRFNNFFTIIKVIVPLLTIAALVYSGFHVANFTDAAEGGFMPFGLKSIFVSVVTCGVVMSFNGFQSPLTFSEEIKSPKTMLPIAVAGSILIALVLYVLLQVAFIGSLSPALLIHGWNGVNLRSPYVELLLAANMQIMVTLVYAGSVISPGVCGAAFIASSSRIMFSLSREGHLPKMLSDINPIFKNPRKAIIACMLIGCIFLFMFRGWYQLVAVISVIHLFSYLPAPIVVVANRIKNRARVSKKTQFMMPFVHVIAPLLLFVLSVLLFYAGWPLIPQLLILVIPGICLFLYYEIGTKGEKNIRAAIKGVSWLVYYFMGLCTIVFLGDNNSSGRSILTTEQSMISLLVLAFIIYVYGAFYAWDKREYISNH
ncbi:MAG: APC family permease [Coxiellaceae bacterium]|nr:APC family permease [Coxiellaceae bacterium]